MCANENEQKQWIAKLSKRIPKRGIVSQQEHTPSSRFVEVFNIIFSKWTSIYFEKLLVFINVQIVNTNAKENFQIDENDLYKNSHSNYKELR